MTGCCGADASAPLRATGRERKGAVRSDFIVPNVHCAGCIRAVEAAALAAPGVVAARLNLSTRRLAVSYDGPARDDEVRATVEARGYDCRPFDAAAAAASGEDAAGRELLRALAIAGFAAANVMLLSVSVWSGAEDATRDIFHWISALIVLPAVAFAGRPFFRSALGALRHGRLNMDVPISLAVLLASALSLQVAFKGGEDAFFDAAAMLLFFLLVGRYLDHRVRARARQAVTRLLSLWSEKATRHGPEGPETVPVEALQAGDRLIVAAGERLAADGVVEAGVGSVDCAALTGESEPLVARPGAELQAGALMLDGPVTLRATAVGDNTFIAQAVRLMEAAENGRARYLGLADRAAQIYAPLVHLIAFAAFIGHLWLTDGDWSRALWIAISVLIITCPCALGLAAPAVQATATGALFRHGVLVKDGAALERLAETDRAVLDKTGALTQGRARVVEAAIDAEALALAGALATQSRHPLARALARHAGPSGLAVEDAAEEPGAGVAGMVAGRRVKIGKRAFAAPDARDVSGAASTVWVSVDGRTAGRVSFADPLRPGAEALVARLAADGMAPTLLSGDRAPAVEAAARGLDVAAWRAEATPVDKIDYVERLKADGHRPLMLGDGVNDGPALAAAHASIAPASASDVGRAAADFVVVGDSLAPVGFAIDVARQARRLVLQNFALAAAYNAVAVPIALLGFASPMAAAIAMSSSSILVTLNALRLGLMKPRREEPAPASEPARREAVA